VEVAVDNIAKRVLQEDAMAAAIREYEMRNGELSDEDE
jgi:hypothetical protein